MPPQKKACFGEYICCKCKNKWKSAESFDDVGQNCRNCKSMVMATKQPLKKTKNAPKKTTEERHLKGAGPFFGQFLCKRCHKQWYSAYSWFDDDQTTKLPQRYKKCKSNVFPIKMRPLEKSDNESTSPHKVELCAKCKKLGYSCEKLKLQRMTDRFSRLRF